MKNIIKSKRFRVGVLVVAVLSALLIGYITCSKTLPDGWREDENEIQLDAIESKYITLQYPAELSEIMIHEVDTFNGQYTDAFYMKYADKDIPLFRFDFGPEIAGDWIGVLETETDDVVVTSVVFVLSEQEHMSLSEADEEMYTACMDAYSFMLKGIVEAPNFVVDRPVEIGEIVEVQTTYWTLMLPSNMTVEETVSEDTYIAMFYGDVAGQHTALYQVNIGEEKAESELGVYEINGSLKPISVGSFELFEKDGWSEEDYSTAYRMMDTINQVIDAIMQSEQFSTEAE